MVEMSAVADTGEALRKAMSLARQGDIEAARRTAEAGLTNGGNLVAVNAFLGMLLARTGDLAVALVHLREAHLHAPSDITIACNYIATLIDAGELEQALSVASLALAKADRSLRIARYRGFVAQTLEKFDVAVEAYAQVVASAPNDFASWNNLGNARNAIADLHGSVDALKRAVELDPAAGPARVNLSNALRAAARWDEAESVLRVAMDDFPADAMICHDLYVLLKERGQDAQALEAILAATQRDPSSASLQLKLAIELGHFLRIDEAERAFRAAIEIDPLLQEAYLGLAIQYEHSNRDAELAPLLARAEANGLNEDVLSFIRALELRRRGEFEAALVSLDNATETPEPERTAHIRATLLDRLGRTDEAFAAFAESAGFHAQNPSDPLRRAAALRQELARELETLTPDWAISWQQVEVQPLRSDPVFLVGFPRSGTTLLDTILMGHRNTAVLEEQPPLNLVSDEIGGMPRIPELRATDVNHFRARYFEEVDKIVQRRSNDLVIDKSPLFLHKVPLIVRLFPNARFILVLRHPCDVVLSCFMSNFKLNAAMSNFLSIRDAAEFYDLTFRHWERSARLFHPRVHTIVYERLINDVEAEVRPLFDFLQLDWEPDALDHQRTAKARGLITTASYSQVTEPIYRRAAGRWERYRAYLEPALPVLQPWITKLGYAL